MDCWSVSIIGGNGRIFRLIIGDDDGGNNDESSMNSQLIADIAFSVCSKVNFL